MEVTQEELSPCNVKLTVVCDPEQVREGFKRAFKQLSKHVKVPGFRPGHAPKQMVEKFVDKGDVTETAADIIVRDAYRAAIEKQQLKPDLRVTPTVDLQAIDEERCEFSVIVPMPPIVEIGEITDLKIDWPSAEVTDEEVAYQLDEFRRSRSSREPVTDRGIEEGDVAVVSIKPEEDAGVGRNFMTVAGQTFPQLDQALMGMRIEEVKSVELGFPENFQEKDWSGKTMRCEISVNSISAVKLPPLDDEFARSLQTDSVEELHQRVRALLEQAKAEGVREMVTEQLFDAVLERCTVHVPDAMWEGVAAQRLRDLEEEQTRAGKTLEQYAQDQGMTLDQLMEAWKQRARVNVMRAQVIREIFSREKMALDNADLNTELVAMAREYDMTPEEILNLLKKHGMQDLHYRAMQRKVADFLAERTVGREVAAAGKS